MTLRWRWALWCAGLVTATGAIAVIVLLSVTSTLLRDRNAEANGLPVDPPRAEAGQPQPGQGPRAGQPPGQPQDPNEQLSRGGLVADSVFSDMRTVGIILVGGLAVLSLGVGWLVAGAMIKPLHRITAVADEVAGGRFGERIHLVGARDELKQLADTFDRMLDRLDAAFGAQRSFTADASHELRTPLTVMRAEIDVALDDPDADATQLREALQAASVALADTTRLVESLLALSRSEVLVSVEDHDLATSVERSAAVHLGDRPGVVIDAQPATTRGDGLLLDRIVDNLVCNAARYTPEDGRIWIRSGLADTTESYVTVTNDGPILDEHDIAKMFERFHRRDGRRNPHGGAGLGLAIVGASVSTHGGTLVATPRSGGGLDVTVRLPAGHGETVEG